MKYDDNGRTHALRATLTAANLPPVHAVMVFQYPSLVKDLPLMGAEKYLNAIAQGLITHIAENPSDKARSTPRTGIKHCLAR